MKTEIYNVEGIEIEVERTSKDDTEAERRKMAYTFKMIREQSGMNRKDWYSLQNDAGMGTWPSCYARVRSSFDCL